jgi:hypothetical protein
MTSIFLVFLVVLLESAAITWVSCRFAEGLFNFDLFKKTYVEPWLAASMMSVLTLILFAGYAAVSGWRDMVPTEYVYNYGVFGTLLTMAVVPFAAAAVYGVVKLLTGFGGILTKVGTGIRALGEAVRSLFSSRKSGSIGSVAQQVPTEQQVSEWQQALQKFRQVANLCSSLRSILKEGQAFNQLGEISETLAKVEAVLKEDANKKTSVAMLLSDYLIPTALYLEVYERVLKRGLSSAKTAIQDMEEKTLPLMATKIGAIYDQIHVNDIAQLSTASSAFEAARTIQVTAEAPAELHA